ncbi:MAG: class II glutamine amidotransferase [Gammaproteobacteria bacterium]|nr:class II glutamine amidotransferase [Gammaproteobacteria bacterium]
MCRLAAYLGPELILKNLLEEDPHSLLKQSWACNELQGTSLNADGFGFGWYQDDSAASYTSTMPIWSDANLPDLQRSLSSDLWLAYVRSATAGQATNQANTQPFRHERYLFLHNGRIDNFNDGPRSTLHAYLPAEIASGIEGNTDSEYLFAMCRHHLASGMSPAQTIIAACQELEVLEIKEPALLNIILSDGESLFACRHAINGAACPTLYFTDNHPHFPKASVIASEIFSLPEYWQAVEENTVLIINRAAAPESIRL